MTTGMLVHHRMLCALLLLSSSLTASAAKSGMGLQVKANPIRKAINMLEHMLKTCEETEERDSDQFEDVECACKKDLAKQKAVVAYMEEAGPRLSQEVDQLSATIAQLNTEWRASEAELKTAKAAVSQTQSLRRKEMEEEERTIQNLEINIQALDKAMEALKKGVAGAFLQTNTADVLRKIVDNADLSDGDRDSLGTFLQSGANQANDDSSDSPGSSEIIGIMKGLKTSMSEDMTEAAAAKIKSANDYESLMATKEQEISSLEESIKTKKARLGELAVLLVDKKDDLDDIVNGGFAREQKLLARLQQNCDQKTSEYEKRKKLRSDEKVAITQTIKLLNDDESLDLFKKTMGASSSFLQLHMTEKEILRRAREALKKHHRKGYGDYRINLIALSMSADMKEKVDFTKVLKMIDSLVDLLKKEGQQEEGKKALCKATMDDLKDKKLEFEKQSQSMKAQIEDQEQTRDGWVEEIEGVEDQVKDIEEAMRKATELRQTRSKEFTKDMADDQQALSLLRVAKEKLDGVYSRGGFFLQKGRHGHKRSHYTPSPANNPAMIYTLLDGLLHTLELKIKEAQLAEETAQKEYEEEIEEENENLADKNKRLTDLRSAKANIDTRLQRRAEELARIEKQIKNNDEVLMATKGDCDWLLENWELRVQARTDEIKALKKAKAVLSGADYSFLQEGKENHHSRKLTLGRQSLQIA